MPPNFKAAPKHIGLVENGGGVNSSPLISVSPPRWKEILISNKKEFIKEGLSGVVEYKTFSCDHPITWGRGQNWVTHAVLTPVQFIQILWNLTRVLLYIMLLIVHKISGLTQTVLEIGNFEFSPVIHVTCRRVHSKNILRATNRPMWLKICT